MDNKFNPEELYNKLEDIDVMLRDMKQSLEQLDDKTINNHYDDYLFYKHRIKEAQLNISNLMCSIQEYNATFEL